MENVHQHRFQTYEQLLDSIPAFSKTLKACYRHQKFSDADKLYITACAPIAVSFVNWILTEAQKRDIKRLYFLARDGYPFYMTARHLCNAWNIDIECRYLSVSRYAIRLPEYHLLGKGCLDRICIGGIDITFRKILKRAALTDAEIMHIAEVSGYSAAIDKILNYKEIMELKKVLNNIDIVFEYIFEHSRPAYDNAIGYLTQEGLLDGTRYAFVDSGWTGTLQQSIQNLLRTKKRHITLEGFYFGLYELPEKNCQEQYHSYFFSPKGGLKSKIYFSNCLFEAIFSAPEGMTLGYIKSGSVFGPLRDGRQNSNAHQLRQNTELLRTYLEEYTKCQNSIHETDKKELAIVQEIVSTLMANPTELEMETFGNQIFSDDVLEHDMRMIAARLSDEDIKNQRFFRKLLIVSGIKWSVIHESAWLEASIVRNGGNVKVNLRHVALYKYFLYLKKLIIRH